MRIRLDPDAMYASHADPWSIGDARTDRYDAYRRALLAHARDRSTILDIGSGFGAFLGRFRDDFERAYAIEPASAAVAAGRRRHPWITFEVGSAGALERTSAHARRFGAIVYSDVIYYLGGEGRARSLDWIAHHLAPEGVALIAAYAPGGRYLDAAELAELVRRRFVVLEERELETRHAFWIVRAKRRLV